MVNVYRTRREAQEMSRRLDRRVHVHFVVKRIPGVGWELRLPRQAGRPSKWQLEMNAAYPAFKQAIEERRQLKAH
jgi:hypothetical protein